MIQLLNRNSNDCSIIDHSFEINSFEIESEKKKYIQNDELIF